jgi:hypothetical protein
MANASDLHHNLHSLLLVIGLAVTSFGLLIMGQAIPNEPRSTVSANASVQGVHTYANGKGDVLVSTHVLSGEETGLIPTTTSSSNRLTDERFAGEGVGRKGPIATSRDDKRAYLLEATAMARNLAHAGGCERTERPLGGDGRACMVAAELPSIIDVPGARE